MQDEVGRGDRSSAVTARGSTCSKYEEVWKRSRLTHTQCHHGFESPDLLSSSPVIRFFSVINGRLVTYVINNAVVVDCWPCVNIVLVPEDFDKLILHLLKEQEWCAAVIMTLSNYISMAIGLAQLSFFLIFNFKS